MTKIPKAHLVLLGMAGLRADNPTRQYNSNSLIKEFWAIQFYYDEDVAAGFLASSDECKTWKRWNRGGDWLTRASDGLPLAQAIEEYLDWLQSDEGKEWFSEWTSR